MVTVYRSPLISGAPSLSSADGYYPFGQTIGTLDATQSFVEIPIYVNGWIDSLRCYVSANTASLDHTLTSRIDGVDTSCTITIGAGLTGFFEDTTNYEAVASGDNLSHFWDWTGGTGSVTLKHLGCDLLTETATSIHTTIGSAGLATASVTRWIRPSGVLALSSSDNATITSIVPAAATAKNARVYVSANPRTSSTTLTIRNGATAGALGVTIGAGLTGWFDDTSSTETFAAGDEVSWEMVTGSGSGTITYKLLAFDIECDGTGEIAILSAYSALTLGNNQTRYVLGPSGRATAYETTEAFAEIVLRGAGTISDAYTNIFANAASNDTVVTFRKNNADQAITYTVPALTTGTYSDTTNSFTYADGDKVCIKHVRGSASSGNFTLAAYSFLMTQTGETDPTGGGGGSTIPVFMHHYIQQGMA